MTPRPTFALLLTTLGCLPAARAAAPESTPAPVVVVAASRPAPAPAPAASAEAAPPRPAPPPPATSCRSISRKRRFVTSSATSPTFSS